MTVHMRLCSLEGPILYNIATSLYGSMKEDMEDFHV